MQRLLRLITESAMKMFSLFLFLSFLLEFFFYSLIILFFLIHFLSFFSLSLPISFFFLIRMEIARAEKDYDKMDLIGKAIQRLEDDIKLHKVKSSTDQKTIDIGSTRC